MAFPREHSRPATRRLATLMLGCALALGATACSSGDDRSAEPTTTTRGLSTTTTAADPVAAEVIHRYDAFWDARFRANQAPPNPDAPELREFAIDAQLAQVVTETRQRLDQGLALRRASNSVSEHRVKVVSVTGDTAELQDCLVDDDVVYRTATGETVDNSTATRNVAATMRRVDGAWKLATTRVIQKWEGVAGCARSSDS